MIVSDPHTAVTLFCDQVATKKDQEYIVVHTPSGLTGKTHTKKLSSRLADITTFVDTLLKQKEHLPPEDLGKLKDTYAAVVKEQTPWYHKILAFFSKSYREEEAKVEQLLINLSKQKPVDPQKNIESKENKNTILSDTPRTSRHDSTKINNPPQLPSVPTRLEPPADTNAKKSKNLPPNDVPDKSQHASTKKIVPTPSVLTKQETKQKQTDQAKLFITQLVHEHLKPYFNGTITPENDNLARTPLIKQLEPTIRARFPLADIPTNDIERQAFDDYLKESLQDFTKKIGGYPMQPEAPEEEDLRETFEIAFLVAIKNDFTPNFRNSLDLAKILLEAEWAEFRRATA